MSTAAMKYALLSDADEALCTLFDVIREKNMYGKKVEFMPWSKLPFRDPSERIARVGQGFSKMLSMINPDQLSTFNRGMS